MTDDAHLPTRQPHSAHDPLITLSITRAELRGVRDGVRDLYHFLRPHKTRIVTYGLLVTFAVAIVAAIAIHQHWALVRMVDKSSIVRVDVEYALPDLTRPWKRLESDVSWGTGSIIHGNRILTAAHVITNATKITVTRADQDQAFEAQLVAASYEVDLAILTVSDSQFFDGATPLELRTPDYRNDEFVAYGYPREEFEYAIGSFKDAERDSYSLSRLENLKYCVDAPIEPGYSGGPLAWQGKIAGVTIEGDDEEGLGYAVPAEVVLHFLQDIEDGRVDGSPTLVRSWQPMQNPQLRDHYGLTQNQTGVLIKQVINAGPDHNQLRAGDVLMAIDGSNIDNDGTIAVVPDSRVSFQYLIDRKQVADTLTVQLLRDRRPMTLHIPLSSLGKEKMRLVRYLKDQSPSYLVAGGFVFSPLTRDYTFDFDDKDIGWPATRHLYRLSDTHNTPHNKQNQPIVLVRLLPHSSTTGYDDCLGHVVTSVDGRPVTNMKELAEILENPKGQYHRILLAPDNKEIVLSGALFGNSQQSILEKANVPADRSPDMDN